MSKLPPLDARGDFRAPKTSNDVIEGKLLKLRFGLGLCL
jgi:hypothetical protein